MLGADKRAAALVALTLAASVGLCAKAQDRLPLPSAGELTPQQSAAAQQFLETRKTPVFGPFIPLLRGPDLMLRAKEMSDYLRYNSALPPRLSEFATLIVARAWSQNVEWEIHQPIALKASVAPATVAAIAAGRRPDAMNPQEEIVYDVLTEIDRNKSLSDKTYDRAVSLLGDRALVDLVGVDGYYTFLAMILNVARTANTGGPTLP
jgi:4-carboxymuconolactone decarboxylase